jgi:uncharacterized protein
MLEHSPAFDEIAAMKLSLDFNATKNTIRAYGEGWISVNDQQIRQSVIVTPEKVIVDWPPQTYADLDESHFEPIKALGPEIVLLGTGSRQQFPPPGLTRSLLSVGIGLEVMNTAAACRTYNIIMAEGRRVVAALLVI